MTKRARKTALGKLFSEVLLVAPQLNLQEKPSACERKKKTAVKNPAAIQSLC